LWRGDGFTELNDGLAGHKSRPTFGIARLHFTGLRNGFFFILPGAGVESVFCFEPETKRGRGVLEIVNFDADGERDFRDEDAPPQQQ